MEIRQGVVNIWIFPSICLMSGSYDLDRASNVKIGVEWQIFVIVIFFNCSRVLQFEAHSRYYKGALTQKRSFLVICTTFRSAFGVSWKNQNKHSMLNSSFNTLSKWHEPDIRWHAAEKNLATTQKRASHSVEQFCWDRKTNFPSRILQYKSRRAFKPKTPWPEQNIAGYKAC